MFWLCCSSLARSITSSEFLKLFLKVKKGVFRIPEIVHQDCQHLIKEMIKVDPTRRITVRDHF